MFTVTSSALTEELLPGVASPRSPRYALAGPTVTGGRINAAAAVAKAAPPSSSPPSSGGSGATTSTPTAAGVTTPPLVPVTTPITAAVVRLTGARRQNFLRSRAAA
jgi:hypothetical protein